MKEKVTEQDLLKMNLEEGGTVQDLVNRTPENLKSLAISAAFECLKRGWPLNGLNIGAASRELPIEEKTKTGKDSDS